LRSQEFFHNPEGCSVVFVTGDTHSAFGRFRAKSFSEQKKMTREDCVIICGDFGGVWCDSAEERYWLDWLENKPFTTLFVDGNHKNFTMLNALPERDWHGGKVHEVRPHVLHLVRGQAFQIGDATFFVMGGAASHDLQGGVLDPADPGFERERRRRRCLRQVFRVKGKTWWPEELPNHAEYEQAENTLARLNYQTDYIITHCAPSSIIRRRYPEYGTDRLTDFLEKVREKTVFRAWAFGHYHDNQEIDGRFLLLLDRMVRLL